jgi:integrase
MARQIERLSAKAAAMAREPGMYPDGNGLYLRVAPGGSKSWVLRYRINRRRTDMGLGSYAVFSLADARQRAHEQKRKLADKIDPIAERRGKAAAERVERMKARTFRQCVEDYLEAHSAAWRGGRTEAQWRQSLSKYAYPVIGEVPVADIDVSAVLAVLKPMWLTRTETGTRIRERIERVLDAAMTAGYRPEAPNPARWKGHLDTLLPKRSKIRQEIHHPALPYVEIGAFMQDLRARDGIDARSLEFAILTAGRSGEVLNARWQEINLAERVWTVPAERAKTGKGHRVPLSDAAFAIVERMAEVQTSEYVFPGSHGAPSRTTMYKLLRKMHRDDITVHGFRSTFRDWAGERSAFPREIAEAALAHAVGDQVERAYSRGDALDKRRQLMDAWATFCERPAPAGEVVPIRA